MRTTHTFGIQFVLRPNKKDRSRGIVYARITVESKRAEISLKKTLSIESWNEAKGKARGSSLEVKNLNSYLEQVHAKLTECYRELQLDNQAIYPNRVKAMFLGDNPNEHTILELFDYHNSTQSEVLTYGTLKNYKTTRKYIATFLKNKCKSPDINLSRVSFKFITDFEYYLRTIKPKDHQKPLQNNGLMKHMQRLNKILNLGVRLEWLNKNPLEKYDVKFIKVERGFLNKSTQKC